MTELRIYTQGNFPFRMGGNCRPFIATVVEVGTPVDMGKGVMVCPTMSPKGTIYWVEATFGSLHGTSLEELRAQVESGDPEIIAKQLEASEDQNNRAETYTPNEFWGFLREV